MGTWEESGLDGQESGGKTWQESSRTLKGGRTGIVAIGMGKLRCFWETEKLELLVFGNNKTHGELGVYSPCSIFSDPLKDPSQRQGPQEEQVKMMGRLLWWCQVDMIKRHLGLPSLVAQKKKKKIKTLFWRDQR